MSDIEQMSYKDLIFMQKNLKIISHIRILTARAFKCSVAREEEEGRGWQGRLDCRTGNVGSFAPVQIENKSSHTNDKVDIVGQTCLDKYII